MQRKNILPREKKKTLLPQGASTQAQHTTKVSSERRGKEKGKRKNKIQSSHPLESVNHVGCGDNRL